MVDKEDNFNEFLKQKVEESRFEYNEAYWLKAEKLIEDAQPKRKPFWLGFGWGMLSLAIICGLSAILWQINQKNTNTGKLAQHGETGLINNAKGAEIAVSKTASSSTEIATNDHLMATQSPAIGSNQEKVDPSKSTLNASNSRQQNKNSVLHNNVANKNKAVNTNLTASTYRGSEGNFSQVKNLSFPKLPESSISKEDEEEDNNDENTPVISIAEPIIFKARSSSIKDIDVNIVAACENKNTHEWMFSMLAGVSDSRGFEGNTTTSSRIGFGYYGGLRVGYKLNKNWFLGIQPLVYSRGAINTSIETEKTAYDFGANADEFIVKNKSLLFAELPVTIGYRVQRHQISVGAGFEYLVNVKSDVKEFGTMTYTPNQWGYTAGFNRYGTVALFNYAFNVYNEFWLTMMVQKGFTDLTKADYFTTNSEDKNFNLRIGLQYQFNNQKKKGK
jgi:hypothetical protein